MGKSITQSLAWHASLAARFLRLEVESWMEYRYDFFMRVIVWFLASALNPIFLYFGIFSQVSDINGWTFPQMLLLGGMNTLISGIWVFIGSYGIWQLSNYIRSGEFDVLLTRPIEPLFQIFLLNFDDDGIGWVVAGLAITLFAASMLGIQPTIQNIVLFGLVVVGGLLTISAIFIAASSVVFLTTQARSFMGTISALSRVSEYPLEIYAPILAIFVSFIIPVAFANYYPAEAFVGAGQYAQYALLTPVVGIILFAIAYAIWHIGLRSYASGGG